MRLKGFAFVLTSFFGSALAGQGTIMSVPGDLQTSSESSIVVLKVDSPSFEALNDSKEAVVGNTFVENLSSESSSVISGFSDQGKPVIVVRN
jgi:hypothetical protein